MIQASNLYAPNLEQRLGYFTYKKKQYWGREIPSFNAKLKEPLRKHELQELAYAVGTQLGRGHCLSSLEKHSKIPKHLKKNKEEIILLAHDMSMHAKEYYSTLKKTYTH